MAYSQWKSLEDVHRYAQNRYRTWDQRWLDRRERQLVDEIFHEYRLSGTILDLPAGYGRFHRLLATFGSVFAADLGFYPLLYERLNLRIASLGVNCDAAHLPLADSSVDVVFSFRLMQHLHTKEERTAVLKEFSRVSRQWIVVSLYLSTPLHRFHRRLFRQPSRITMLNRETLQREFREAGVGIVKKKSILPGLHAHQILLLSSRETT